MAENPRAVTLVAHEVGTPGGMERQLGELAAGLLDRGYEVTVVARSCGLEPHPRLRLVVVRGPRRPFSLWYPWFFVAGSLAVARHARGLVHTTGALVLNRADLATVHFCHRAFRRRAGGIQSSRATVLYRLNGFVTGAMARAAERLAYRGSRTRRLVAVSQGVAAELRDLLPARARDIVVIPNGVDHAAFAPDPGARAQLRAQWGFSERDPVALFVGGDWERKGLRFAVEALRPAPSWRLVVAGAGDEAGLRGLADGLGVLDRVRLAGRVDDPAPLYAAADAFVLPTAYETFSLVTYEAAAAGLPLLVCRVSGVEELLVEGRNGWFVERDAAEIAARLRELEADPDRRRAMGEAARADSARFDWGEAVAAYDRLYRELAAQIGSTISA